MKQPSEHQRSPSPPCSIALTYVDQCLDQFLNQILSNQTHNKLLPSLNELMYLSKESLNKIGKKIAGNLNDNLWIKIELLLNIETEYTMSGYKN